MNTHDRFLSKVTRDPSGCWLWTGAISDNGYGSFHNGHRTVGAHRYSFEHYVGPIPDGLVLDHLCRVTNCVNPAHLEPVTHAENIRRGYEAKAQTHCKRGHDLLITARWTKDGRRDCRECDRIRKAERTPEQQQRRRETQAAWARKKYQQQKEAAR